MDRRDRIETTLRVRFVRALLPRADADAVISDWLECSPRHTEGVFAGLQLWRDALRVPGCYWWFTLRTWAGDRGWLLRAPGRALAAGSGDLVHAVRSLRGSPGISLAAVSALAIGVGLNGLAFGVSRGVFGPVLPLAEPERLVSVYTADASFGGDANMPVSRPNFLDLRASSRTLEALAAYLELGPAALAVARRDAAPTPVATTLVSDEFFATLAVEPELGRLLDVDSGTDQLVISYSLWRQQFGGDVSVVGSEVLLNGARMRVAGVASPEFNGLLATGDVESLWTHSVTQRDYDSISPGRAAEHVWAPLSARDRLLPGSFASMLEVRRAMLLMLVGRLAPGRDLDAARLELGGLSEQLARRYPAANADRTLRVFPLSGIHPNLRPTVRRARLLAFSAVGLVLLVACVNIASVLLARVAAREREIAVRLALGARRAVVVRQVVAEAMLLGGLGAALGLVVAFSGRRLMAALMPAGAAPPAWPAQVSLEVVAFVFVVAAAAVCLFGVLPALRSTSPDPAEALGGARRPRSSGRTGIRGVLLVGQVALTTVAVVGAARFLHSRDIAQHLDPGFDMDPVGLVTVSRPEPLPEPELQRSFGAILDQAREDAHVESAAWSQNYPFGGGFRRTVTAGAATDSRSVVTTNPVSSAYFDTLGLAMLRGRDFDNRDVPGAPFVAIVNEAFLRRFALPAKGLGERLRFYGVPEPLDIIGVVADQVVDLGSAPEPIVYLPDAQWVSSVRVLNVRLTDPSPATLVRVADRVRGGSGALVTGVTTVRREHERYLWAPRSAAAALVAFSLITLGLAALGVYGAVAQAIESRSHEIRVRLAHGASHPRITWLVIRGGMAPVLAGLALGAAAALAARPVVATLLYGTESTAAAAVSLALLLPVAVGGAASWLSARRMTHWSGVDALRS